MGNMHSKDYGIRTPLTFNDYNYSSISENELNKGTIISYSKNL